MENKYQEALNNVEKKDMKSLLLLQELINNYSTMEKALDMVCERLSFTQNDFEAETQEEAQSHYIYLKYTRPKQIKEKYLKKARKNNELL